MPSSAVMALDVGEKRIGVAIADNQVKIAVPFVTIAVDGTEIEQIARLVHEEGVESIVVGYPRNQSGEPTQQTEYVEAFAARLNDLKVPVIFQDESLTSVHAEERLKMQARPYEKSDIDKLAASIFLQDYLEQYHGRV